MQDENDEEDVKPVSIRDSTHHYSESQHESAVQ
jgi:hypothetical protein